MKKLIDKIKNHKNSDIILAALAVILILILFSCPSKADEYTGPEVGVAFAKPFHGENVYCLGDRTLGFSGVVDAGYVFNDQLKIGAVHYSCVDMERGERSYDAIKLEFRFRFE